MSWCASAHNLFYHSYFASCLTHCAHLIVHHNKSERSNIRDHVLIYVICLQLNDTNTFKYLSNTSIKSYKHLASGTKQLLLFTPQKTFQNQLLLELLTPNKSNTKLIKAMLWAEFQWPHCVWQPCCVAKWDEDRESFDTLWRYDTSSQAAFLDPPETPSSLLYPIVSCAD